MISSKINFEEEKNKILSDAESAVEEISNRERMIRTTNEEKRLKFSLLNLDPFSIKYNLIKEINSANLTYSDLKNFCEREYSDVKGKRKAYNVIQGLDSDRDFRTDTIDAICKFLNISIVIEEKNNNNKFLENTNYDQNKTPIKIDINPDSSPIIQSLSSYFNDHCIYYSDLIAFCEKKFAGKSIKVLRKAYNVIKALKDGNDVRASTIELICEFLNVDLVIIKNLGGEDNEER